MNFDKLREELNAEYAPLEITAGQLMFFRDFMLDAEIQRTALSLIILDMAKTNGLNPVRIRACGCKLLRALAERAEGETSAYLDIPSILAGIFNKEQPK